MEKVHKVSNNDKRGRSFVVFFVVFFPPVSCILKGEGTSLINLI